jgi:hypothetical protein
LAVILRAHLTGKGFAFVADGTDPQQAEDIFMKLFRLICFKMFL